MKADLQAVIQEITQTCGRDPTRLMDIVRAAQKELGALSDEVIDAIAAELGVHRVQVESQVSFYAFLGKNARGKVVIRLCDDIADQLKGYAQVAAAFQAALGVPMGGTTPDGLITLEATPCIGMCDQAPAALVNDVVVTHLTPEKVPALVAALRGGADPATLVTQPGDGQNAHPLVQAMVQNNIRQSGPVVLAPLEPGLGLGKALDMDPAAVVAQVKASRLRGRGGAGFPTGMKWEFTRNSPGDRKVIVCNADEGEPGTFKDRVILTEAADSLFEGMTIAGWAVGADMGLLYLRAEYAYLLAYLEEVLALRRERHLLGFNILGKGFSFDIRIQLGAGAYVCGEETSLLSSAEGLRGDPKNRPPFPAQKGFLGLPTVVNNVETYCCAARILEKGADWFTGLGSKTSPGTKLLSVAGDCTRPGVYEVPFGTPLQDFLALCGGEGAIAVQVGGPSGTFVAPAAFGRKLEYDDLATGGSLTVFGPGRNLLDIVSYYLHFFVEESCGYCTPCRVGNTLLKERVDRIRAGRGEVADLAYLKDLGTVIKTASRCGLGQTSPNPVLTTLAAFPDIYSSRVRPEAGGHNLGFDLHKAVAAAEAIAGRRSVHAE